MQNISMLFIMYKACRTDGHCYTVYIVTAAAVAVSVASNDSCITLN